MSTKTNPPAPRSPRAAKEAATAAGLTQVRKVFALKAGAISGNSLAGVVGGMGNLDSWDDVIFPGAYSGEVIADFLAAGFVADAHDWDEIVAMPTLAEVRSDADTGLQVMYSECEFHSDQASQRVKTICSERLDKGLAVGLSVGIGMYADSIKTFPSGAALLAWAEKQGYDMALFDVDGITACARKCRAILRVDKWYEYSPVPLPANGIAWANAMKAMMAAGGAAPPQAGPAPGVVRRGKAAARLLRSLKAEHLGDGIEASITMAALQRLSDRLFYWVFYDCVYYDEIPLAERRATLEGGLDEYKSYVLRVFDAIMAMAETDGDGEDGEDGDPDGIAEVAALGAETPEEALTAIRALWADPDSPSGEPPAGSPFEKQLATALAAVEGCAARAQAVHDLRKKSGRALSTARREQLTAQREGLAACLQSIDDLLAGTDKSAGDEDAAAPAAAPDPSAVRALLAKSLTRENSLREAFGPAAGGDDT